VIAALKYLANSSGFQLGIREYDYAGREQMWREWLMQIKAAFPEARVTMCVGAKQHQRRADKHQLRQWRSAEDAAGATTEPPLRGSRVVF
jgi:hypothetical protein